MAYRRDREGDCVADQGHSYAPRDDSRSEATYCHDSPDRVQRAVDRVLVTPQILLTEGAEGFTHQIDLLSTAQRRYAGFTAVARDQDGTFRPLLATAVEPSCVVHTVANGLMLLRLDGSA